MILKNGRSGSVACNGEMLMNIIHARGFNHRELSTMLGYEKSYFSKVVERNKIGSKAAVMLADQFGIKPQQYGVKIGGALETIPVQRKCKSFDSSELKITPVLETGNETITLSIQIDTAQLSNLIKQAVTEAFNNL